MCVFYYSLADEQIVGQTDGEEEITTTKNYNINCVQLIWNVLYKVNKFSFDKDEVEVYLKVIGQTMGIASSSSI